MCVIVVVCVAFCPSVSEAKTGIICYSTKGMPEETNISSVEVAGQMYHQTNELFVYLGELEPQQHRSIYRGRPAHTERMVQLPEVHP